MAITIKKHTETVSETRDVSDGKVVRSTRSRYIEMSGDIDGTAVAGIISFVVKAGETDTSVKTRIKEAIVVQMRNKFDALHPVDDDKAQTYPLELEDSWISEASKAAGL